MVHRAFVGDSNDLGALFIHELVSEQRDFAG